MNEIITARDCDIIAAEINTIKEDTQRVMIANAIRIGGKLTEAKAMLDHGQWGKWLEERVSYSQSTANNLMKLYQEYGTGEVNLFDNWTNSETFGKLTYTQHLSLLALPFADRAEFAENHNVEDMSTRELDKAVREEVDRLKAELEDKEATLEAVTSDRNQLEEKLATAIGRAKEAESEISGHAKTADRAMKDLARAEQSEKTALGLVKKLETELATAKTAEKVAREELGKALSDPTIPDDVMERMRKEIAAEEAKKATSELEKKLADAQKVADAASAQAREAEERLAAAQKQIKMSDPDIIAYQTISKQMMETYKTLNDLRLQVAAKDADAGERLTRFQTKMLTQWVDVLQNV